MYDWVLDTPLEGFVQDAPRQELDTAPAVESLPATAWQNLKLKFPLTFSR